MREKPFHFKTITEIAELEIWRLLQNSCRLWMLHLRCWNVLISLTVN